MAPCRQQLIFPLLLPPLYPTSVAHLCLSPKPPLQALAAIQIMLGPEMAVPLCPLSHRLSLTLSVWAWPAHCSHHLSAWNYPPSLLPGTELHPRVSEELLSRLAWSLAVFPKASDGHVHTTIIHTCACTQHICTRYMHTHTSHTHTYSCKQKLVFYFTPFV